mgnify:FL=1
MSETTTTPMDLMTHFGLGDTDKVQLTPDNLPKGREFVSASSNRMYRVDDWETAPDGKLGVILTQTEPGETDLAAGNQTWRDMDKVFMVFAIRPESAVSEEEFGEQIDDDFGEPLGETPEEVAPEPEVEELDVETGEPEEAAELVASPEEVTSPEPPPVPEEVEEEIIEPPAAGGKCTLDSSGSPHGELPQNPPVPGKIVEMDDRLKDGNKAKQRAVFFCASRGMTVPEAAQYCLDQVLYTRAEQAESGIRRTARMLNTAGYGVWLLDDDTRLMLSKDGVTPEPYPEGMEAPADEPELIAQQIRAAMDARDPKDLPEPLQKVLTGLRLNPEELMLSPRQMQGVIQIAWGLALLVSGK